MSEPAFKPTYTVVRIEEGYRVTVKPPEIFGLPGASLIMDHERYDRFERWRSSRMSVQEVFPELSAEDREILISGVSPRDYKKMVNRSPKTGRRKKGQQDA